MGLASFNRARREKAEREAKAKSATKSADEQKTQETESQGDKNQVPKKKVEKTPKKGSVDWLKLQLDSAKVVYPKNAKKKALKALFDNLGKKAN